MPDDASVVGRVIATRYLVEAPCERTAHSSIYRARYLMGDRTVLLRVLPGRAGLTRQACRSALSVAERAAALSSPHVARTLDVGAVADRWPFVVSEYSKGTTLATLVASQGALGVTRALTIGRQLASALGLAHAARLAHGDLRLDGIWTEALGGRPAWARLLDFGVSELAEPSFERSESGVFRSAASSSASPGFTHGAAQEDLRALAAVLYELATGSAVRWLTTDVSAALQATCSGSSWTGERALARGLALVLERALGLAPDRPYVAVNQLLADLDALGHGAAAAGPAPAPAGPVTTVHAPPRRTRVALGGPKVIVRG